MTELEQLAVMISDLDVSKSTDLIKILLLQQRILVIRKMQLEDLIGNPTPPADQTV